ncbi:MAG: PhzF family phenazine biosynthesis isomerase, partial [Gammaproteobacteria bacterium]
MATMAASRTISVEIVGGFVTSEGGGNPAGVVFDADTLDERDMLEVARRVGLSETAFVSRSSVAGFKLDFFTPNRRIAHCGHATIAAFARLAELGRVQDGETSKETVDGTRRILIREGAAYMEQLAPDSHAGPVLRIAVGGRQLLHVGGTLPDQDPPGPIDRFLRRLAILDRS